MDNNIHINPESIGKFMAISDVPVPEGYESPITGYISQLSQQIIEQRDNEVVAQISEQIAVDVNKDELIKALNYDRNQFNEGYRKGYRDATEKYEEADRWRPLSQPPKEHDYYLVTCEFGVASATDIALFYPDRKGEEQWSLNYVTAWKPLPEPYESEAENE